MHFLKIIDYDSDEDGTFSKSAGDDSWKSDADMSLSLHGKVRTLICETMSHLYN